MVIVMSSTAKLWLIYKSDSGDCVDPKSAFPVSGRAEIGDETSYAAIKLI